MSWSATPIQFARYVSQGSAMHNGASVSAQQDQWIGSVSANTPSKSNRIASYKARRYYHVNSPLLNR